MLGYDVSGFCLTLSLFIYWQLYRKIFLASTFESFSTRHLSLYLTAGKRAACHSMQEFLFPVRSSDSNCPILLCLARSENKKKSLKKCHIHVESKKGKKIIFSTNYCFLNVARAAS